MEALSLRELAALQAQRWFAAKGRVLRSANVVDRAAIPGVRAFLAVVEADFRDGALERYLLVRDESDRLDMATDPEVARSLLRLAYDSQRLDSQAGGTFAFWHADLLHGLPPHTLEPPEPLGAEQSNTSIRYGDALVLKLYRRLRRGINPEVEIGQLLSEGSAFRHMPLLAGTLNYRSDDGAVHAAGVFQTFVPNRGDLWTGTLARLRAGTDAGAAVDPIQRLGEVLAELHLALAASNASAFVPERITSADVDGWLAAIRDDLVMVSREAGLELGRLEAGVEGMHALVGSLKIRHHGDFHLGQVIECTDREGELAIVDFEGEPARPVDQRREKRSPLRDVAGLLRSLDYARQAAGGAEAWHTAARAAFMRSYIRTVHGSNAGLLPADEGDLRQALTALEIEKAAYEVLYELRNRPHMVEVPLSALRART